jgi:transcriptional regulator with XRE-family HTH domain
MIDSIDRKRDKAGVTQKALCARAGVHETTYSALKAGRRGGNAATITKLAEALQTLIDEREAVE